MNTFSFFNIKKKWRRRRLIFLLFCLGALRAWAGVDIVVTSATPTVMVGDVFTVEVKVEFNTGDLDAAEVHLDFDPTYLQVLSVSRSAMSILPLEVIIPASIATINSTGAIDYAAGTASNFPNTNFTLLTIQFQAIAAPPGGTTPLTLNTVFPRKTDAQRQGNSILDALSNLTMTINSANVCFFDDLAADFNQGTPDANTYVATCDDGEVILKPAIAEEFNGAGIPTGWASAAWNPGGTATVTGGMATVDGARITNDNGGVAFGPGTTIEFVATFQNGDFQNIGFASDLAFNNPFVTIGRGTGAGSNVFARNNSGQEVSLGTTLLGTPHKYKIEWKTDGSFAFYLDGVLIPTPSITQTVNSTMLLQISDFPTGAPSLSVDWMYISPYPGSGTFTSRVYDAGVGTNWNTISWQSEEPAGTGISVSVRTGDTPTPDGTWTAFTPVMNGANIGTTARYIQYQAVLTTASDTQTPVLEDISIACTPATCATLSSSDADNLICQGDQVMFTAGPTGGTYEFFLNGNSVQMGMSNTYSYMPQPNETSFDVYVMVTNAGSCSATSQTITTTVSSPPTVSLSPTVSTICPGDEANLSVNITGGTPTYAVELSNNVTYLYGSSGTNPISPALTPNSTTIYSITSITDGAGCVGTVTGSDATANVVNLSATLQAPVVDPCAGDPITLPVNISGGNGPYTVIINNRTYTNVTNQVIITPSFSIWNDSEVPAQPANDDDSPNASSPIEVGTRFQATVNGLITGIRFYKGWALAETYTVNLYSNDGLTLVATASAALDATTGWRIVNFNSPVIINASTTYVAALSSPTGSYAFTGSYFTTDINRLPLIGLEDDPLGDRNAVYQYGGGFPTNSFNSSNYWVDVVFVPNTTATFNLTSITDANGCVLTGNPISTVTVTIDPACGPFPIELLDFTATPIDNERVLLKWSTASETNNAYFSVQRSTDGRAWAEIGQVKGSGTTQEVSSYAFWDQAPNSGVNYYRLQQFDFDGSFEFHRVVTAFIDKEQQDLLIYPNLAREMINIQFDPLIQADAVVRIIDMTGRQVDNVFLQSGSDTHTLNIRTLVAGTYVVVLQMEREIKMGKFVKE